MNRLSGPRAANVLPRYGDLLPGARPAPFAVIGDTQETMFGERYLLRREHNPVERAFLLAKVAEWRPGFLVVAGDFTCDGGSPRRWDEFDRLAAGLRRHGIPVLPCPGNHDYWGGRARGQRALASRFPQLDDHTWYLRRSGSLALIFVDTNRAVLTRAEWEAQAQWYAATMAAFEHDTSVAGVLVFAHHPPFTNGTATGDDAPVQRDFVPPLVRSRKALAMISGHTHAYEHFVEQGKHFIVTGGGGGPRVRLRAGRRRRHRDHFEGPSPRPFHCLWITPQPGGVEVEVRGFEKGETGLRTLDRFELVPDAPPGAPVT